MKNLLVALAATVCSPAYAQSDGREPISVEYDASAFVSTGSGPSDIDLVDVELQEVPKPEDFTGFDRTLLYEFGYVDARCMLSERGELEECVISEAVPDDPVMHQLYKRALGSFVISQPAVSNLRNRLDQLNISFQIRIPGGKDWKRDCFQPFCIVEYGPPPPPPPPAAAE